MIVTDEKDQITEKIRHLIRQNIPEARENNRAEMSLCTLSFQSTVQPERQVWIDTDFDGIGIDLEDWSNETEWDNAVARIAVESPEEVVELVKIWLSGGNLDNYANVNKDYERVFKIGYILEKG